MMMMRLISFIVCLSIFIGKISAQSAICNSIEDYNTHDLVTAYEWTTNPGYGCLGNRASNCTFYFSFCQLAPHCNKQYSACEISNAENLTMVGALSTTVFYPNGTFGFYAKFPAGPLQNITNKTSCTPELRIEFECDPEVKWLVPIGEETGQAPEPEKVLVDPAEPCGTIISFKYAGACHKDRPTTVKPPSGGDGLGGGAIFLIILFSVIAAYFLIGIAYNGLVNHHSGAKLLPHSDFWIGLPIHAIAGCRCLLSGCGNSSSSSPASSPSSYDSV